MGLIEEYFSGVMGHHYTAVGILSYGIIFAAAVYLVYEYLLKRIGFRIDSKFMLSLVPFIIFGGITRALKDTNFYQGFFFMSPGIYITIFFITLLSLLLSIAAEKRFKKPYWIFMLGIGGALVLFDMIQVALIGIENWTAVVMILGLFAAWAAVFAGAHFLLPKFSKINAGIAFSHAMDASQNFVGVAVFGYSAQMPLNFAAESFFGSWIIFPIKISVVLAVLLLIDKYSSDKEFNTWLKLAILILGLPMGFRGMLRVGMGV
ncbi:MAG: DUF63 family protein [Candidatus Aenigmatarchaeota archaeon]